MGVWYNNRKCGRMCRSTYYRERMHANAVPNWRDIFYDASRCIVPFTGTYVHDMRMPTCSPSRTQQQRQSHPSSTATVPFFVVHEFMCLNMSALAQDLKDPPPHTHTHRSSHCGLMPVCVYTCVRVDMLCCCARATWHDTQETAPGLHATPSW